MDHLCTSSFLIFSLNSSVLLPSVILSQQGSPWSDDISLAILNFHESGVMEELETTWIDSKNCAEQSNSPATLGLSHMLGRFLNPPPARLTCRGRGRRGNLPMSSFTLLPLSPKLDQSLQRWSSFERSV